MGQCVSRCCPCCDWSRGEEYQSSYSEPTERTRLLAPVENSEIGSDIPENPYRYNGSGSEGGGSESLEDKHSNDEQSIMSRILHSAAHELIDVSASGVNGSGGANHPSVSALESHEYSERAKEYAKKLSSAAPSIALKFNQESAEEEDFKDIASAEEREEAVSRPAASEDEIDLITTLASRANESRKVMIKPPEDLVVPFGNVEE